jgi:hypothetical protein
MSVAGPTNTHHTHPEEFLSNRSDHALSLGPHSQASEPENADELFPAGFIGVEVP